MMKDQAPSEQGQLITVLTLGTAQTLAWASSFYLPAIVTDPLAADLGISTTSVFAAFSASLVVSAAIGPKVGRTIDTFGGRGVLVASNLAFASGLTVLGLSQGTVGVWLAWALLGVAMGLGLYDSAFATLGRIFGAAARRPITGITLLAGFASTIGWPLSALGVAEFGWRNTCFAWAAAHIVIGLPLNLSLPPTQRLQAANDNEAVESLPMDRTMVLLAVAFATGWVVAAAMAAHMPRILAAAGASPVEAVAAAALMGPAQVAARVIEATFLARFHPLFSARLSTILHPAGAAFVLAGASNLGAFVFTGLHGAGNGILTIARGTVPFAIYGPKSYGYRLGLLGAPARIAQAGSPLLFGLLLEVMGAHVLIVTSALSLIALVALAMIPAEAASRHTPASAA